MGKRKQYSDEVKQAVLAALAAGESRTKVCETWDVPYATAGRWVGQAKQSGLWAHFQMKIQAGLCPAGAAAGTPADQETQAGDKKVHCGESPFLGQAVVIKQPARGQKVEVVPPGVGAEVDGSAQTGMHARHHQAGRKMKARRPAAGQEEWLPAAGTEGQDEMAAVAPGGIGQEDAVGEVAPVVKQGGAEREKAIAAICFALRQMKGWKVQQVYLRAGEVLVALREDMGPRTWMLALPAAVLPLVEVLKGGNAGGEPQKNVP